MPMLKSAATKFSSAKAFSSIIDTSFFSTPDYVNSKGSSRHKLSNTAVGVAIGVSCVVLLVIIGIAVTVFVRRQRKGNLKPFRHVVPKSRAITIAVNKLARIVVYKPSEIQGRSVTKLFCI